MPFKVGSQLYEAFGETETGRIHLWTWMVRTIRGNKITAIRKTCLPIRRCHIDGLDRRIWPSNTVPMGLTKLDAYEEAKRLAIKFDDDGPAKDAIIHKLDLLIKRSSKNAKNV